MIRSPTARKAALICSSVAIALGINVNQVRATCSTHDSIALSQCITYSPSTTARNGLGGRQYLVGSLLSSEHSTIAQSTEGHRKFNDAANITDLSSFSLVDVCEHWLPSSEKTEPEKRQELAIAGYPFAGTAPLAEIERVYGDTAVGCSPPGGAPNSQYAEYEAITASYQPAPGPMFTRWAADVSQFSVHPEYPRPQMARDDWLNLNGLWQYQDASHGESPPLGQDLPERILVPFPVESALSGIMRHVDRAWYRRTVDIPASWAGQRVLLHFGAVDWEAHVYVNGQDVGTHWGGYDPFRMDITDALKSTGPQEIVVGVFDPTDSGEQPRGKQVHSPTDIWYTATTGIWQTVWMEPVPATRVERLRITPDVDLGRVHITTELTGNPRGVQVHVSINDGEQVISSGYGAPNSELALTIAHPKLWSPTKPHLYDLRLSLYKQGRSIDTVNSYFGMRKIEVSHEGDSSQLKLNGQPIFQVGVLDQGYWPDGLYTAPTDAALRYDIETTKWLGYNLIRKHMKVEPDRWYYWADRLGILVWQDMPMGNNWSVWGQNTYQDELRRMMSNLHNHPSVITWVIFNEYWGQFSVGDVAGMVRQLDPSRLVIGATGYADQGVGDLVSFHSYRKVEFPQVGSDQAKALAEWGGLGLPIAGHTWPSGELRWAEPAHIESTSDASHLIHLYHEYTNQIRSLRDNVGLSAAIYSQLTDVERETTGLLTYDRATLKVNAAQLRAINQSLY